VGLASEEIRVAKGTRSQPTTTANLFLLTGTLKKKGSRKIGSSRLRRPDRVTAGGRAKIRGKGALGREGIPGVFGRREK